MSERIILRLGRQMLLLFLSLMFHKFMNFRIWESLYVIILVKNFCKSKGFCKSKTGRKRCKCINLRKGDNRKNNKNRELIEIKSRERMVEEKKKLK